jgi:hypothetical protein
MAPHSLAGQLSPIAALFKIMLSKPSPRYREARSNQLLPDVLMREFMQQGK